MLGEPKPKAEDIVLVLGVAWIGEEERVASVPRLLVVGRCLYLSLSAAEQAVEVVVGPDGAPDGPPAAPCRRSPQLVDISSYVLK